MENDREIETETMSRNAQKRGKIRDKRPFQVWWDKETETLFKELVVDYDEELPSAVAVVKLIKYAVKEWWLPGYIKKERIGKRLSQNKMGNPVIRPNTES